MSVEDALANAKLLELELKNVLEIAKARREVCVTFKVERLKALLETVQEIINELEEK